jgi:SAM-dependent methyltransferase
VTGTQPPPAPGTAEQRWRDALAAWRIPDPVLAAAPEDPWACPPEAFRADDAPQGDTPARGRARAALPEGGTVLDVGCGGGAASLPLVPPAGWVVGVDTSADLLRAFADAADARRVPHREVQGRWPDVTAGADAPGVPVADVVVCHHVAYNVPDLAAFAHGLDAYARRRVVCELTGTHPLTWLGPLWRHFHGLDRPSGPTADLAADVLREAGLPVRVERTSRRARPLPPDLRAALARRRLCLPYAREPEVARLLAERPDAPREVVTLWWDRAG